LPANSVDTNPDGFTPANLHAVRNAANDAAQTQMDANAAAANDQRKEQIERMRFDRAVKQDKLLDDLRQPYSNCINSAASGAMIGCVIRAPTRRSLALCGCATIVDCTVHGTNACGFD
jgi:hypothetical protein